MEHPGLVAVAGTRLGASKGRPGAAAIRPRIARIRPGLARHPPELDHGPTPHPPHPPSPRRRAGAAPISCWRITASGAPGGAWAAAGGQPVMPGGRARQANSRFGGGCARTKMGVRSRGAA